jgi:hypothetical protein
MGIARKVAASLVAAVAVVVSGQTTASAGVQYAVDNWWMCASPYGTCDSGTEGTIVWGQRTAVLNGHVWDDGTDASSYVKVYFDAFAGSVKVDSDFRTANNDDRSFGPLTLGDPDRVGGIDRIRIQVCAHFPDWPYKECSTQENEVRD